MACLSENRIAEYVDKVLTEEEMLEVYEHLLQCPKCLETVAAVAKGIREFNEQNKVL